MFEHLLHMNMRYFCPYLCYIQKCNMAEPMLHIKIWYLSVSALFFFFFMAHVNSNVYEWFYQNIQKVLRDRASVTVFQNLNLVNASANPKWHLTISWATCCQYQCVCKVSSQQSTHFGHFHFFKIWSSAQPRPMLNDILQSLGLDSAIPLSRSYQY